MFFKQAVRGATECDVTASQVGGKKRERARESLPDFFLYLMMIVGIVGRRHFVYLSASVAEYHSWIDHEGRLLQARSKEIYRDIHMGQHDVDILDLAINDLHPFV